MTQILTLRAKSGISQIDLAKRLSVSQSAVSQWETGASKPRIDTLIKLAAIFGCTVDELLTERR